jgi:hypothetical protein
MGTQFALRIYATSGVVRKADAKKMTSTYYWALRDRVLEISAGNKEIAQKRLAELRNKKYSKQYHYEIVKYMFTTECKTQAIRTKIVESGIL